MTARPFDIVIPSIGRPSLRTLLHSLVEAGTQPRQLLVVDDRPQPATPLVDRPGLAVVLAGPARGPAAARNLGWTAGRSPWVVFLDDDVEVASDWATRLAADLEDLPAYVGGSQGRITVPLPAGRAPTDWERNVAGLADARWATADMAYRRHVLQQVGGFDERFPRAYREDADLALRVRRAGYALVVGERQVIHPVRPASWRASIRLQAGNADDVLMAKLHGSRWRVDAGAPPGRLARHRLIAGCGALAVASAVMGRRRLAGAGAALWLAGTGELAWARLRPGPLTTGEIGRMVATSAVLPAAASLWWLRGLAKWRTAQPSVMGRPAAVLFDRDGTLVADVPYNGDPDAVVALPGARQALERIRRAGLPIAVVSNQSGVGRKGLGRDQVDAVNTRVEQLLGPFDAWCICPHAPEAGCGCRKPAPGLILSAARRLGVTPERCVVIGDIGADVEAARAAGARSILVPTPQTRVEEVAAAPEVAIDLLDAVGRVLEGP